MDEVSTGDVVMHNSGAPWRVRVLSMSYCSEEGCKEKLIHFQDPESGIPDTAHASEFHVVSKSM